MMQPCSIKNLAHLKQCNQFNFVPKQFVAGRNLFFLLSLSISLLIINMMFIEQVQSGFKEANSKRVVDTYPEFDCKERRGYSACQSCCQRYGRLADYDSLHCVCYYYAPAEILSGLTTETEREDDKDDDVNEYDQPKILAMMAHDKLLGERKFGWNI